MSDLEEFKVVETSLGNFKSSSGGFHLSPDINEGFKVSRSRDLGIFEVSEHEIEFRALEIIHTFLKMPGVFPPIVFSQGIPFGHGLGFCFREIEDIPDLFFKEKDFFYWGLGRCGSF